MASNSKNVCKMPARVPLRLPKNAKLRKPAMHTTYPYMTIPVRCLNKLHLHRKAFVFVHLFYYGTEIYMPSPVIQNIWII